MHTPTLDSQCTNKGESQYGPIKWSGKNAECTKPQQFSCCQATITNKEVRRGEVEKDQENWAERGREQTLGKKVKWHRSIQIKVMWFLLNPTDQNLLPNCRSQNAQTWTKVGIIFENIIVSHLLDTQEIFRWIWFAFCKQVIKKKKSKRLLWFEQDCVWIQARAAFQNTCFKILLFKICESRHLNCYEIQLKETKTYSLENSFSTTSFAASHDWPSRNS